MTRRTMARLLALLSGLIVLAVAVVFAWLQNR
jgi:hypothetical protein